MYFISVGRVRRENIYLDHLRSERVKLQIFLHCLVFLRFISPFFVENRTTAATSQSTSLYYFINSFTGTVAGTPYFFINGIFVSEASSAWTVEQWKQLIDQLLEVESK